MKRRVTILLGHFIANSFRKVIPMTVDHKKVDNFSFYFNQNFKKSITDIGWVQTKVFSEETKESVALSPTISKLTPLQQDFTLKSIVILKDDSTNKLFLTKSKSKSIPLLPLTNYS